VKTTINLRDDLAARAKALAQRESTTLAQLIEEGLTLRLRKTRRVSEGTLKELPVSPQGGGLRMGIEGSRNQSLFGTAEE
jgi:hypothetical protein